MKTLLLAAAIAANLVAASAPAFAGSQDANANAFVRQAEANAAQRLNNAGVSLGGRRIVVRGVIGGDGRLRSLSVVDTSGSRDTDAAVTAALNRMDIADAPASVVGAALVLRLVGSGLAEASGGGLKAEAR
jgi:hypothetical protein